MLLWVMICMLLACQREERGSDREKQTVEGEEGVAIENTGKGRDGEKQKESKGCLMQRGGGGGAV